MLASELLDQPSLSCKLVMVLKYLTESRRITNMLTEIQFASLAKLLTKYRLHGPNITIYSHNMSAENAGLLMIILVQVFTSHSLQLYEDS